MAKVGRNAPCPCGSGRKFKKCCREEKHIGLLDPGPVPQHVEDATDKMMAEEGYTHEVALQLRELARRRKGWRSVLPAALFGAMLGEHI
jgi:hypothetical protein